MELTEALRQAIAADYELLRPLGEGSMGRVFLAREPELRRLVAIKVPLDALAHDAVVRRRFEREARAAARVQHPSAIAIHRVGRMADDIPFIVMEYVQGRTVADLLQAEGPLPAGFALNILTQVADALAAAHAHGIVHRDVRPGNVLWEPHTRRAVLSDFGIAGILETGAEVITRLTGEGQVLGDPSHMSPEQLTGAPATEASDVYSCGILAFELLTGRQPFRGEGAGELARAHIQQAPRDLLDMLEGADPRLAQVLAHCIAAEPRHRPSAASLARHLREISAAGAPGARSDNMVGGALSGFPGLAAFLEELRRRRVVSAAILYLGAMFVLLQGAQLVIPALPAPAWLYPALVCIGIAAFPAILVLGWIYDITATGLRRTDDAGVPTGPHRGRLLMLQALGLVLALALAAAFGYWLLKR